MIGQIEPVRDKSVERYPGEGEDGETVKELKLLQALNFIQGYLLESESIYLMSPWNFVVPRGKQSCTINLNQSTMLLLQTS